jgi:EAL domain-containing protein (putative c-di-GMP-specific phosphodiesterase class I)
MEQKYYLPIMAGVYIIDDPKLNLITIQDRANSARKSNKEMRQAQLCSIVFYSEMQRLRMVREREITNRMESALTNDEFIFYLQPQVELENERIVGAEALVRWADPQRGVVYPNEFIPTLEKNGFITKLDIHIFEKVCKLIEKWIGEGRDPVPVSVNLSRLHLTESGFLDEYERIKNRYSIPDGLIQLELTETVVYENFELIYNAVDRVHKLGFVMALDDFGSGYSSLNLLKDIPVDILKLDRGFFDEERGSRNRGEHIIEGIISLARKLDMVIVAEGVESMAQLAFLKQVQCDMVQGYIYSKPVSIEEFEELTFAKKA